MKSLFHFYWRAHKSWSGYAGKSDDLGLSDRIIHWVCGHPQTYTWDGIGRWINISFMESTCFLPHERGPWTPVLRTESDPKLLVIFYKLIVCTRNRWSTIEALFMCSDSCGQRERQRPSSSSIQAVTWRNISLPCSFMLTKPSQVVAFLWPIFPSIRIRIKIKWFI